MPGKGGNIEYKEMGYFRLFRDVCRVISSSLDVDEVLNLITENIVKALNVKGCAILLLDRRQQTLELSASHGLSQAYLKKGPLEADKFYHSPIDGGQRCKK